MCHFLYLSYEIINLKALVNISQTIWNLLPNCGQTQSSVCLGSFAFAVPFTWHTWPTRLLPTDIWPSLALKAALFRYQTLPYLELHTVLGRRWTLGWWPGQRCSSMTVCWPVVFNHQEAPVIESGGHSGREGRKGSKMPIVILGYPRILETWVVDQPRIIKNELDDERYHERSFCVN